MVVVVVVLAALMLLLLPLPLLIFVLFFKNGNEEFVRARNDAPQRGAIHE